MSDAAQTPAGPAPGPLRRRAARLAGLARAMAERHAGYAFVLPLLAIFAGFYLWPALNTLLSSFFEWGLLGPWRLTEPGNWEFAGVGNYVEVIKDPVFWTAVVNTGVWLVFFPLLITGLSLIVSILIWTTGRGIGAVIFRTAFILPMTISLAAVGVVWGFIYNPDPDFGLLNAIVGALHLDVAIDWGPLDFQTGQWLSDLGSLDLGFTELRFTNLSLIVPAVWAFLGFGVITFTAGLASVDEDLIDAARVDGARLRQVVRHVLVPQLRGSVVIVGVVSVIFALRTFDLVFVLTDGGPANDTQVLALLLWKEAFVFLDSPQAGSATAIAVLLSLVMIIGAYPYLRRMLCGSRT